MKINWKIHKPILIKALKELSDRDYQVKVWLNTGANLGMTLSFTEAVNNVFDDACVSGALEENLIIFDKKVTRALQELHDATDAVDEFRSGEEIINDPLMEIVRKKAAIALDLIKSSDGSEGNIEIVE